MFFCIRPHFNTKAQTTATKIAGSIFATFSFFSQIRFTPTQKISRDPIHAPDHHHRTAAYQTLSAHGHHFLDGSADPDKHDADSGSLHQRILHAFLQKTTAGQPQKAAGNNRSRVYNCSQSTHSFLSFPLPQRRPERPDA